jgi:hypothetical protein
MVRLIEVSRFLLVALVTALVGSFARAMPKGEREPMPNRAPGGDPMLGMLIILGGIVFFILLAWVFSRMGDDGGKGPDHTML